MESLERIDWDISPSFAVPEEDSSPELEDFSRLSARRLSILPEENEAEEGESENNYPKQSERPAAQGKLENLQRNSFRRTQSEEKQQSPKAAIHRPMTSKSMDKIANAEILSTGGSPAKLFPKSTSRLETFAFQTSSGYRAQSGKCSKFFKKPLNVVKIGAKNDF